MRRAALNCPLRPARTNAEQARDYQSSENAQRNPPTKQRKAKTSFFSLDGDNRQGRRERQTTSGLGIPENQGGAVTRRRPRQAGAPDYKPTSAREIRYDDADASTPMR